MKRIDFIRLAQKEFRVRSLMFKCQKALLSLLFIFAMLYGNAEGEEISRIRAMVNNEVITSRDVDDYCNFLKYRNPEFEITPEVKDGILQRLIEDKLIVCKAKQEIQAFPKMWLKERMDELVASYPSYEAFEQSLRSEGLTITMLKEKLKNQYLTQSIIEKCVRSKIEVSPQKVTEYYEGHNLDFVVPRECTLWVAKSENRELLQEIPSLLDSGGIDVIDREKYKLSKVEVKENSLKTEIKDIVRTLCEGEYTIKDISGIYYFVYVEEVKPFSLMSLEDARGKIFSYLWEQKFKASFSEWVDNLKKDAVIKIYE